MMTTPHVIQPNVSVMHRSSTHNATHEQIWALRELEEGWHFGQGSPPSSEEAISAIRVVGKLRSAGAESIEVFPDPNGGILVAGYGENGSSIEILCRNDGLFDGWTESKSGEEHSHPELRINEIIDFIEANSWHQHLSSVYSIHNTLVEKKRSDTPELHLRTRQVGEYPSLTLNAHSQEAAPYVVISPTIIRWQQQGAQ